MDKIGYLNAEQALADYAVLLTDLKKEFQATNKPIVAFGGRYDYMQVILYSGNKVLHVVDCLFTKYIC